MKQEPAQTIAISALGWLASQDTVCEAFLHTTGADAGQLRSAACDPGFLAAVLDFILQQDEWVLDCADSISQPPEQLVTARAVLGGGDQMHWT
ncbi:hypothetical protein BFP70_10990 [Thioclava sp. SK-1]|uniref:DUF3572 domain-containing protein n=1 Tax=Thioclava sp. SK-1 TaxID=1889770 RepID=UPI0008242A78|nr:DUF3572 domain-containing protein [Thioclava sp. SK-1]OCX64553.1 hypothetical protein BFP70_10990 [Thioclava sp. SK-1]